MASPFGTHAIGASPRLAWPLPAIGAQEIAETVDGGAWATNGDRLVRIAPSGNAAADVDLATGAYGTALKIAVDAYSDGVWIVTDAGWLLRFDATGALRRSATLPGVASDLAIALDETPWVFVDGILAHYSRDASLIDTRPIEHGRAPVSIAVDALRNQMWIVDDLGLGRVTLGDGSARPSREPVSVAAEAIAIDVRTGEAWVVENATIVVVGPTGVPVRSIEWPRPQGVRDVQLDFDAARVTAVLHAGESAFAISRDGSVRTLPTGRVTGARENTAPMNIAPTIGLVRPPSGAATPDPSPEMKFRIGAACDGDPCELPFDYLYSSKVAVTIDGIPAQPIGRDHADVRVRPAVPLSVGPHTIDASVADRFTHVTKTTATLTILERAPAAMELPAMSVPGAGVAGGAEKAANRPPTVSLTSPTAGATFGAGTAVSMTAAALDPDGTVSRVEFYRNGTTLIATASAQPYQAVWLNAQVGTYTLTAKAYDNRNGTAVSMPVSIAVVANAPPIVELTAPADGASHAAGTPITLSANASDADGVIGSVEFLDGDTVLARVSRPPFEATWADARAGFHLISARATDDKGGATLSQVARVTVRRPPVVVIRTPEACATIDLADTLELAADAISVGGSIARVDFYDGEALIGTAYASPWDVRVRGLDPGLHSFTAVAVDASGLSTRSRPSPATVAAANRPPSIQFTSPVDNARFPAGSSTTLTATAADADGSVTAVEFRFDGIAGALIGRSTNSPYSVTWSGAAAGDYTLVAVAIDDRRATTVSDAVHVGIDANAPPVVSLTSPAPATTVKAPASVTLSATANDADGTIARVDFFADASLVGTAAATPFTTTWNSVQSGNYAITARATDNLGASATSEPVSLTVAANLPPSIRLIQPSAGTHFAANASIMLSADPSDGDGTVSRVEFRANGTLLASASTPPYTFAWNNAAPGAYDVTATAVDDGGAQSTTASARITVDGQPEIAILSPGPGAVVDDDTVLVQGYVAAPPNSAVTVNGIVTHIDDLGRFQVNDVPLVPGPNNVTAVVTTQDGQTASQSILIDSSGAGIFIVQAAPTEGLDSLTVTFTVENPSRLAFKEVTFDVDGNGSADVVAPSSRFANGTLTVNATYPVGTWYAIIKVYDDSDQVIYLTRKSIVVLAPTVLEGRLRGVYDGMLARLRSGDVDAAMTAMTGPAQAKYRPVLAGLGSALPSTVDQLGQAGEITFGQDLAELNVIRNTPDGPIRFMLYLLRAEDGIWRIDGM
ncbi:MAG: Ig-like domain-containing protein [Betaproteobacteria bacterium]